MSITLHPNPKPSRLSSWYATVSQSPGIPPRLVRLLIEQRYEPDHLPTLDACQRAGVPASAHQALVGATTTMDLDQECDRLQQANCRLLTLADADYPARLKEIPSPPPILYVRGSLGTLTSATLAVVGTRRPTPYGLAALRQILPSVAAHGVTIISGLALGIDALAHRIALEGGSSTIAVLGTGIDVVYPSEHRELAKSIEHQGALITEFPPGAEPERYHFPQRNRIIAGLAQATLLIEAGERSGALITAKFALDQNRDVLAVPGPITSPQSIGTNSWLKLGAQVVTTPEDILKTLNLPASESTGPAPLAPTDPQQAQL